MARHGKVFEEGRVAYSNRRPLHANPYTAQGGESATEWDSGWHAAEASRARWVAKQEPRDASAMLFAYGIGAYLTGVVTFLVGWVYAVKSYGLFVGLGLGWLPALVIAALVAVAWPILALAGLCVVLLLAGVFGAEVAALARHVAGEASSLLP